MDLCNFRGINSTTDLYLMKTSWQLLLHSMFWKIYSKSLDSMPLILTLLENVFSIKGTLQQLCIRTRFVINGYFQTVNKSTGNSHYSIFWHI